MKRGGLFAFLLVLLVFLILFADVLLGPNILQTRDFHQYHIPMRGIVRELVLGGGFPYWNPYYSAGEPLAANPAYHLFYPVQLFIFLPDFIRGYHLYITLHMLIAAAGMIALLRFAGLGTTATLFGTLSFVLSGFYLSLLPNLFEFSWTPLALFFALRYLRDGKFSDFAWGAIAYGMQMLVGEPAIILQTAGILGAFALHHTFTSSGRPLGRTVLIVFLFGFAAAAVGAAQLIPMADFFRDTMRAAGFPREIASAWSMPPVRLFEFFFPAFLGRVGDTETPYWGVLHYSRFGSPFVLSIYLGLIPAVLALTGFLTRARYGLTVFLIVLSSLVISFGSYTPVFDLLYSSGVFRSMRYPERFAFAALFALVFFAATVLQRLIEGDRRTVRVAVVCTSIAGGCAFVAAILPIRLYSEVFRWLWRLPPTEITAGLVDVSRRDWWTAAARAVVAVAIFIHLWKRPTARSAHALIVVFVLVDLLPLQRALLPRLSRTFLDPPPVSAGLPKDKGEYRVFHLANWLRETPDGARYWRRPLSPYWVERNGMFPYTTAIWGYRTVLEKGVDATMLATTYRLVDLMHRVADRSPRDWTQRYAAISNVGVRAELRPFESAMRSSGARDIRPVYFVVTRRAPRYYFADRILVAQTDEEFVNAMSSNQFTPSTAIGSGPAFRPAAGRVLSFEEKPGRIRLQVESAGEAMLIASVSFHRYWRATVDHSPAPISRVNMAYQGVIVPAGRHEVVLRYRNPLVLPSAAFSAIVLIFLIASTVLSWKHRQGPAL